MKKRISGLLTCGIIVVLVAILVITSVFDSGKAVVMKNVGFKEYIFPQEKVNLSADYNLASAEISLLSSDGNKVWNSSVEEEKRLLLSDSRVWQDYMASLIAISYTDSRQNKFEVKKLYSASQGNSVSATETSEGISYTVNFESVNITVTVEMAFNDSVLTLRIPADKIEEGNRYLLTAVEIMPFFGAADHNTDGYIFYPDGCGALMRYENYANHSQAAQTYTMQIYGSPELEQKEQMSGSCMLPVYGIKNGQNAFIAAVTAGAADCNINISAEGNVVALNRASFTMNYRYTYTVPGSDIVATAMDTESTYADSERLSQDFECVYFFLTGEKADYSGMANVYRNFLLENNLLGNNDIENEKSEISIDFVTGVTEKQMLFNKNIAATTFDGVLNAISTLKNMGLEAFDITLSGWEKGGIDANSNGYKPWGILGGKSKLSTLCKEAESLGVDITLAKNVLSVTNEDDGYSVRDDVIYAGNEMVLTNEQKTQFVLNNTASLKRLDNFIKKKPQSAKILLEDYGCYLSADYSADIALSRSQDEEYRKSVLKQISQNEYIGIEGGNMYALEFADKLTDIPSESSKLFIADKEIPFYQMLVHGSVAYTGEPFNLSYDSDEQFLKMLEFGYQPYFVLTEVSPDTLKYTACNDLFSCEFDEWKKSVGDIYEKIKKLSSVKDQKMIKHSAEGDISTVTYENGYKLLINYSDEELKIEGYTVEAKSFILLNEKGAVK